MLIKILQGVIHGTLEADFKIHMEEQRAKNIKDILKKKSKKVSYTPYQTLRLLMKLTNLKSDIE